MKGRPREERKIAPRLNLFLLDFDLQDNQRVKGHLRQGLYFGGLFYVWELSEYNSWNCLFFEVPGDAFVEGAF